MQESWRMNGKRIRTWNHFDFSCHIITMWHRLNQVSNWILSIFFYCIVVRSTHRMFHVAFECKQCEFVAPSTPINMSWRKFQLRLKYIYHICQIYFNSFNLLRSTLAIFPKNAVIRLHCPHLSPLGSRLSFNQHPSTSLVNVVVD